MNTQIKVILADRKLANISALPVIMCGIGNRPRRYPLTLSPRLTPAGDGDVLYYPGCGTDYGPLVHFAQSTTLRAAVYVDYLVEEDAVKAMLDKVSEQLGWSAPPCFTGLESRDLGVPEWSGYWPEAPESTRFADPTNGTGFQCELTRPSGPIRFVFLRTEGHQTYTNLLRTPLQPSIVVLQDHGFGSNWQPFGGCSDMFFAAEKFDCMPPNIFVAEGTEPWPGFNRTEPYIHQEGQMHHHVRALFERNT